MTGSAWVVLLEAAETGSAGDVSYEAVQQLLVHLEDYHPSGLWALGRYAVQLIVPSATPATAVDVAVSAWRDAVRDCGIPSWELVRAEVKTLAELKAEMDAEMGAEEGDGGDPAPPGEVDPALRALPCYRGGT